MSVSFAPGPTRKLSPAQVNEVVRGYEQGRSSLQLAEEYGVTDKAIRQLLRTRTTIRGGGSLVALAEALGAGNRVDLEWMNAASCRETLEEHGGKQWVYVIDPDEWAAPKGEDDASVRKLRTVCARCPVRRECLEWAFQSPDSIQYGIYGLSTGTQRMRYRNHADPVGKLMRWGDGWRMAKDKQAYERRTRRAERVSADA